VSQCKDHKSLRLGYEDKTRESKHFHMEVVSKGFFWTKRHKVSSNFAKSTMKGRVILKGSFRPRCIECHLILYYERGGDVEGFFSTKMHRLPSNPAKNTMKGEVILKGSF